MVMLSRAGSSQARPRRELIWASPALGDLPRETSRGQEVKRALNEVLREAHLRPPRAGLRSSDKPKKRDRASAGRRWEPWRGEGVLR